MSFNDMKTVTNEQLPCYNNSKKAEEKNQKIRELLTSGIT